eukprot:2818608-Prymnesium_polylepis.1
MRARAHTRGMGGARLRWRASVVARAFPHDHGLVACARVFLHGRVVARERKEHGACGHGGARGGSQQPAASSLNERPRARTA